MNIEEVISYIRKCNTENIRDFEQVSDNKAYTDFISIKKAKETNLLPADYHDYFKDRCECGAEFIIKNNLTTVQCSNPRCYIKSAYRLSNLLENFGLKGIASRTCENIIKSYSDVGVDISHIEAFVLSLFRPPDALMGTAKMSTYKSNIKEMLDRKYTFSELISKLALPDFGTRSDKIFEDVQGIDDLLAKVKDAGSYSLFFARRGVYDESRINSFQTYIGDIILLTSILEQNVRKQGLQHISICITGSLAPNGIKTIKQAYVDMLNEASITKDGIQLFEFSMSSAVKSVPYIVADYKSNTSKYIEGLNRGVLISSTDLLNMVKRMVIKFEAGELN